MFIRPMEILGTHLFLYCPNMTPDGVRADNMRSLPDRVHPVGKLLQIQTLILIDFNNELINIMQMLGMYSDIGLFSTVSH